MPKAVFGTFLLNVNNSHDFQLLFSDSTSINQGFKTPISRADPGDAPFYL
jgi:hypothetical protein